MALVLSRASPARQTRSGAEAGRLHAALVDVILPGRRHLLGELALEVVALPGFLDGVRLLAKDLVVELAAVLFPDGVLVLQLGIGVHRADHRLDLLHRLVLDEGDEAEGLALLEPHLARPGEQPVHREGERQPVGLDQTCQRLDAVLDMIGRAHGPHRPAGRGPEQIAGVEGQHPVAEVRGGQAVEGRMRASRR